MKALAIFPGKPKSIHQVELPTPRVEDVPDGRGVLVKLLDRPGWGLELNEDTLQRRGLTA